MGYTKGPWKLQRSHDSHWRERYYAIWTDEGGEGDRPIASVDGDNAVWLEPGADFANARLIAAAPELLEALKTMLKGDQMGEGECQRTGFPRLCERWDMARSAIAKAEGK